MRLTLFKKIANLPGFCGWSKRCIGGCNVGYFMLIRSDAGLPEYEANPRSQTAFEDFCIVESVWNMSRDACWE